MNYVHKLIMSFICTHIINNIYFFFDGAILGSPTALHCPFGFVVVVVVVHLKIILVLCLCLTAEPESVYYRARGSVLCCTALYCSVLQCSVLC